MCYGRAGRRLITKITKVTKITKNHFGKVLRGLCAFVIFVMARQAVHFCNSAIIAGTTSNRSPAMP